MPILANCLQSNQKREIRILSNATITPTVLRLLLAVVPAEGFVIETVQPSQVFLPVLAVAPESQPDHFVQIHIEGIGGKAIPYAGNRPVFLKERDQLRAAQHHPLGMRLSMSNSATRRILADVTKLGRDVACIGHEAADEAPSIVFAHR